MKRRMVFSVCFFIFCWEGAACDASGREFRTVAPMPPMGWNSWNCFANAIDERTVLEIAEAMAESGMKDAGYEYVVIDDTWQKGKVERGTLATLVEGRDANGTLLANPEKFPNGIAAVAEYVHGLGLKFGIYTSPGLRTCTGCTGSFGYERKDLETFAAWGVDFIKLDWCGCKGEKQDILKPWREALDSLDRPIVLSVNAGREYGFLRTVANLWRTTGDITAVWDHSPETVRRFSSVRNIIESQAGLEEYQGPGAWNDPDMLEVGNGNLTEEENRSHFSMWAMFSAPLIAGNDLRTMPESVQKILTNREVIALDQDALGYPAKKLDEAQKGLQVWCKKLRNPTHCAVALLNCTTAEASITADFNKLGISGPVFVRDLWRHEDLGLVRDSFTAKVPSHGGVLVRLTAFEQIHPVYSFPIIPREGSVFEAESAENVILRGNVQDQNAGYTGSGYVMCESSSKYLELTWFVPSGKSGRYRMEIQYAFPQDHNCTCVIRVNEDWKRNLEVFPTKSWTDWDVVSFEADLQKRVNHICFYGDNGEKNVIAIDQIRVTPLEP